VPTDRIADMPPEARDHEPRAALDGGADGVDLHRRLAAGAADWLAPGGVLLVETSPSQAALTIAAMGAGGLVGDVEVDEEIGGCVAVGVRQPGSTDLSPAATASTVGSGLSRRRPAGEQA
jgi:release factor glutamine methyltransferase